MRMMMNPLVAVFPSKGKEKVLTDEESDNDQDDIDAEIEAIVTKATITAEEKKSLLDIIAERTSGENCYNNPSSNHYSEASHRIS